MSDQRLAVAEVAALLRAAGAALRAEAGALPERVLRHHPAPGEWCVKEVIGHLIEAERRGFAGRIRHILAADRPPLQAWDQDAVAHERRDCERAAGDLLAELATLRDDSVALVAGLQAADLSRGGQHPRVGFLTVGDLVQEWVHHDRNHLRQMLENVRDFVWPAMGAAQRFSGGAATRP
ncbi:MAG TPA: DinB family protein [Methylomirabilota bacterium]|nr:DinB family protein [Methylomirabilota bacterium]